MSMLDRVIENAVETVTIPNPVNITGSLTVAGNAVNTFTASRAIVSNGGGVLAAATTTSAEIGYLNGVTSAIQTQMDLKAPLASPTFTGTVTSPAAILSSETASTIASFDASKNIKSLAVATYPSLTELSYVKGLSSAVQTQMDLKAPLAAPVFTGLVKLPFQELTASGAITSNILGLNHGTVAIAATLAAPVAGEPLFVVDTSATGTAAHTVRLTAGTFDGTNNTATLNAPDEALYCIGVSATRFQIILNVGAVGLSST